MPRRRLAVALVIPPPAAIEIDGLRRALGDRQLARIDPHITLVPPINIADGDMADALAVVDTAARSHPPFRLALGPLTTFGPGSPVRFLAVTPAAPVHDAATACRRGPFDRPLDRPFVPHVTVDIDGGPTDGGDDPAAGLLRHYRVEVAIDRLTVLEQVVDGDGRRWEPYLAYRCHGGAAP